ELLEHTSGTSRRALEAELVQVGLKFRLADGRWSRDSQVLEVTRDAYEKALNRHGRDHPETESAHDQLLSEDAEVVRLLKEKDSLVLESDDALLLTQLVSEKSLKPLFGKRLDDHRIKVPRRNRGALKQALIRKEFPVEDLSGYVDGKPLTIALRTRTLGGQEFHLREYQRDAVTVFHAGGSAKGGSGVLVLPCGAGKTVIGLGIMALTGQHTLILVTNITALRQWRDEILDKTRVEPDDIGEYSGEVKQIRPITITTYQILTYHKHKHEDFLHLEIFNSQDWGLIVYDEVHLLPAPVFRAVADLQARRRLGLTATLVREDGREDEVFSLIGPKRIDVPWKTLEGQGWIAPALCTEVRVAHKTGQAILQMAKLEHADLLILGWRGYTTTREAVFGSVVDTVIDYAPCDLLVVKYEPEPKLPFGNILLPTAGGPSAKFAARLAGHLLEEGGVLTLAGVARKGADEEAMARSRQGVADTIADVPFAVDTERKLLTGASVAAAVLKESRANAYDVIIVGATKVSLLKRAMFGQIPERIAHLSLTPVILAKHHEGARTWLSRFLGK
ncbi:universal stress protein, partial [bacterium]|nr:universal stress protein [bacterium]